MQSQATTPAEYLAELPEDRRVVVAAVRDTLLVHLNEGFEETMQYGMITYVVPHRLYPAGYHCDPRQALPFVSLAAQKGYYSLYLMCLFTDSQVEQRFRERLADAFRNLELGKSCVRFKRLGDLPLTLIGDTLRSITVADWIRTYETATAARRTPEMRKERGPTRKTTE